MAMSKLFSKMLKAPECILDWEVQTTSLEEVFLKIAKESEALYEAEASRK